MPAASGWNIIVDVADFFALELDHISALEELLDYECGAFQILDRDRSWLGP